PDVLPAVERLAVEEGLPVAVGLGRGEGEREDERRGDHGGLTPWLGFGEGSRRSRRVRYCGPSSAKVSQSKTVRNSGPYGRFRNPSPRSTGGGRGAPSRGRRRRRRTTGPSRRRSAGGSGTSGWRRCSSCRG